jgi:hypothetical protein
MRLFRLVAYNREECVIAVGLAYMRKKALVAGTPIIDLADIGDSAEG